MGEIGWRRLSKSRSFMLSTVLGKTADRALEILHATPTVSKKAIFWEWQRRNETLLQKSGDVYFLYMSRLFTGEAALLLFDDFGAVLDTVAWRVPRKLSRLRPDGCR